MTKGVNMQMSYRPKVDLRRWALNVPRRQEEALRRARWWAASETLPFTSGGESIDLSEDLAKCRDLRGKPPDGLELVIRRKT